MAGGFIAFRCGNYESTAEREQFRLLCKKMKSKYFKSEHLYLLIANYNIYDSELDAIVIKHDAILAIEFKNYGGTVVASENGDWTANGVAIKGGSRKTVYQQARINHASIKNGLRELGIKNDWIKNIPTLIVFNQAITLDNRLSTKVQSWLHITDNAHFIDKIEDITNRTTNLTNLNIINLAIKLNLNSFIVPELSSYSFDSSTNDKEESLKADSQQEDVIIADSQTVFKPTDIEEAPSYRQKVIKEVLNNYARFTPNHIYALRPNQIFVFGTDKKGSQKYGASGIAARKFGAQIGVIEGKTGDSYALPTKGFTIDELEKAVFRLINYVDENPNYTYLITPVGCGHAGFAVSEVSRMFEHFISYENVMLPKLFIDEYLKKERININVSIQSSNDSEENKPPKEDKYEKIKQILIKKGLSFNISGSFSINDADGNIIAEAELGSEEGRIVFSPYNIQSKTVFKNKGYSILSPEEYIANNK